MSAFTPTIGSPEMSVNTDGVLVLEQEATVTPKPSKRVKAYHSMRVHVPRTGYSLNNIGFYRLVVLYRLRRNKKSDVFLSESELMKACKVDRASRLDDLVWKPLGKFIVKKTRTYQGGAPCWRITLVDPNVKPDNWREGDGKWFLRVPCWWLWAPETAHQGDRWVEAQEWNPQGAALKAAVALQIADETRGKGKTDGKNTAYFAKVLGLSPKSASEALTAATDLGWIGTSNRTGGKGVKASRWTRWHTTDRKSDDNPRWAAGHKSRHNKPTGGGAPGPAPTDVRVVGDVDPEDPWGIGFKDDSPYTGTHAPVLVTAGAAEPPW